MVEEASDENGENMFSLVSRVFTVCWKFTIAFSLGFVQNLWEILSAVDSLFIVGYTCLSLYRVAMNPQETYNWYTGRIDEGMLSSTHFTFFMKVLINKQAHHTGRSTGRNICFDLFRCLFIDVIYPLIHRGPAAFNITWAKTMAGNIVLVSLISAAVTNLMPCHWFKRQRFLWALLNVEYATSFSAGFIHFIMHLEGDFGGYWLAAMFLAYIELHFHIGGDWLEEFLFADMTDTIRFGLTWEAFSFNLPVYIGFLLSWPAAAAFQLYRSSAGVRFSEVSVDWLLKVPLQWTVLNFQKMNNEAKLLFFITCVCYAVSAAYFQLQWLATLRAEDEERAKDPYHGDLLKDEIRSEASEADMQDAIGVRQTRSKSKKC